MSDGVYVVVSETMFETIREGVHENMQQQADYMQLYFKTDDSDTLVEEIFKLYGRDVDRHRSLIVLNTAANREATKRTTMAMSIFLYGFVVLITLIGVANIFNTISTNVALRRREFAMLKSVGLTPKGFNRILNYETIFYGLKALAYGLSAAIPISVFIFNAFGNMFEFTFFLPWKEIAYCVAGVFIIVFITMLHAAARLKKENIIDALREENL